MNNKIINLFIFTAGAAIGSAVTWKLIKTKYERIAQEEIDSVKEVYSNMYNSLEDEDTAYEIDTVPEFDSIVGSMPSLEEYAETAGIYKSNSE